VNDDYLWNRTGTPDADTLELERLLGRFASAPPHSAWRPPSVRRRFVVTRAWAALAATLVLACSAALWRGSGAPDSWAVQALEGAPTAAARAVAGSGRLGVGDWLETDASSRATLAVSTIGRLDVDPGTRLQLVESRDGAHRLALAHGRVHALIWAPPGQFVVDTPGARAVDLGCIYSLETSADGSGVLEVDAGWVALVHRGREVFIPAGARVITRPRVGPGTPHMVDAPAALVDALAALDFGTLGAGARRATFQRAVESARPEDAVSVWHLLSTRDAVERGLAYDALARLVPPPSVVSREGIVSGTRAMRDAWWNALDLGDAGTWREWQRRWQ
jgi:hypothetical protein